MKIYITRGEQRAGPYSLAQVNAMLHMGRLNPEDFAWYEGCLNYTRVKGIPGVKVIGAPLKSASPAITSTVPTKAAPVSLADQKRMKTAPSSGNTSTPAITRPVQVAANPLTPVARAEQRVMKAGNTSAPAITRSMHAAASPVAPDGYAEQQVMQAVPSRGVRAPRASITCRICESGELKKTILPRFSNSLITLGGVLFTMSSINLIAILLSMIPFQPAATGSPAVTIMIDGSEPVHLDVVHLGAAITSLKKMILENWQFLFLCSFVGFVLFFIFRSRKRVLQCNRCKSVVAIE